MTFPKHLYHPPQIKGGLFGVEFTRRGELDRGVLAGLYVEDDTVWHLKAVFAASWLADLQDTAMRARLTLKQDPNVEEVKWDFLYKEEEYGTSEVTTTDAVSHAY